MGGTQKGGRFRTAPKDRVCHRQMNCGVWLADLDKEKPKIEILYKNLMVYRTTTKVREKKTQHHLMHLPIGN